MNTQLDIAKLVNEQVQKAITEHIATADLHSIIDAAIGVAVENAVTNIASKMIEVLVKQRDLSGEISALVTNEVKTQVNTQTTLIARNALNQIDTKKIIADTVTEQLKINISSYSFPDASISAKSIRWDGVEFSGNMIQGGIIRNFNSTGIQDQSTDCQLTIVDGVIVAERHFISKSLQAEDAKFKTLATDGMLTIAGNISLSPAAEKSIAHVFKGLLDRVTENGIDLGEGSLKSDKTLVLDRTTLGPSVINSNLRKLGLLQDLRVSGPTNLAETLYVTDGKRVGFNTEDPSGVLSIWDDDAELTVLKQSRRNMFVGSTRQTDISFGTNNRSQMRFTAEGIDISDALTVQGIRFSASDQIPDRTGIQHEIVLVRNAREDQPRFYICEGGNRWRALI